MIFFMILNVFDSSPQNLSVSYMCIFCPILKIGYFLNFRIACFVPFKIGSFVPLPSLPTDNRKQAVAIYWSRKKLDWPLEIFWFMEKFS